MLSVWAAQVSHPCETVSEGAGQIEYVLVNGAECEPYLTSDYRRMMEQPDLVVGGLKCMLKLFDNAKGCICIEDNKPDCIAKMTEFVKDEPRIEVKTLKTKYPQALSAV